MEIDLYTSPKSKISVKHDLDFEKGKYDEFEKERKYDESEPIVFKNPSNATLELLRDSGPLPTDGDGRLDKKKGGGGGTTSKREYEELANLIGKLYKDEDIMPVIQLIEKHRTDELYAKSDPDG